MPDIEVPKKKKSKGKKKGKSKISFDEEVVTKDTAKNYMDETANTTTNTAPEPLPAQIPKIKKKKHKLTEEATDNDKPSTKKQKSEQQIQEAGAPATEPKKKEESIRSKKKKKHAQLLEEKKTKVEVDLQQKALNYLSKWKHSRSEWKFEKLRQVWIQQNLFDSSRIPDEFWDTTVEYFDGAKGQSRQVVLDAAIKYIENEDTVNENEDYQIKLKRARDIVQNMQ